MSSEGRNGNVSWICAALIAAFAGTLPLVSNAQPVDKTAPAEEQASEQDEGGPVRVGDRWVYDTKDELTGTQRTRIPRLSPKYRRPRSSPIGRSAESPVRSSSFTITTGSARTTLSGNSSRTTGRACVYPWRSAKLGGCNSTQETRRAASISDRRCYPKS